MPGLIALMRAAPAPAHRLRAHPQHVAALGELVGVERVGDALRREPRQREQVVGRRGGQLLVLLGRQRREPVARLGGDDHARPAGGDDLAELLEHDRGAVEVDRQDRRRRRLARRDARGVDDAPQLAESRGLRGEFAHRLTGGDIDRGRAHREARVGQNRGSRPRTLLPQVGEEHVAPRADPAGDGLPDRTGSDDDDNLGHGDLPVCWAVSTVEVRTRAPTESAATGTGDT